MTKPFRLGLTGSIGMGKTTTAEMFLSEGIPVWDADASVHRLYSKDGRAIGALSELCPACVSEEGVDREALKRWIAADPDRLAQLEAVVHPLVAEDRAAFVRDAKSDIVLLDIPLLFETGAEQYCDATAVVSVPFSVQRERVLARPGMTEEHLRIILGRQMPDEQKRARADYVIDTTTIPGARETVCDILKDIRKRRDA